MTGFTQVSNSIITNKNLSLEEKGLYAFIKLYSNIPKFFINKNLIIKNCMLSNYSYHKYMETLKKYNLINYYRVNNRYTFKPCDLTHNDGFCMIPNHIINDKQLSLSARGLAILVLYFSKIPGFKFSKKIIFKISCKSKMYFDKLWNELKRLNIIKIEKISIKYNYNICGKVLLNIKRTVSPTRTDSHTKCFVKFTSIKYSTKKEKVNLKFKKNFTFFDYNLLLDEICPKNLNNLEYKSLFKTACNYLNAVKQVHINSKLVSKNTIKEKFKKLTVDSVINVIDNIKKRKDRIKHLAPYIVSCLYNEANEDNIFDKKSHKPSYDINEFECRGFFVNDKSNLSLAMDSKPSYDIEEFARRGFFVKEQNINLE